MKENKGFWEKQYAKEEDHLWELQPISTLVDYSGLVDKKEKVLDLGMGEGRNALYFAKEKFEVEGVDVSETAISRSLSYARDKGLSIKAEVGDLISYELEENAYSLIILANVLNFFKDEEIEHIIEKVKRGLVKGGLLYINAFDTNDPGFDKCISKHQQITERTFYRPHLNSYIHFFTREELNSYFDGYQTVKFSETYLLDVSHGEPHYHGSIEILLRNI